MERERRRNQSVRASRLPFEVWRVCPAVLIPVARLRLRGKGWPAVNGNWKLNGIEIELLMSGGPGGCDGPGRYRLRPKAKACGS